ncbi:hypothetical protein HU200_003730 [Digitaria exilis]|uniref:Uncharacterized protein n=1 Tax=Digitaria exilis TaxID=1010633 RepID=A0A835FXE9_9POAL|nr:hypothetical protein HU200_003730 [Digitaria exilis]
MCAQGTYITCANSPGRTSPGVPAVSAHRRAVTAASSTSPAAQRCGAENDASPPPSLMCVCT